MAGYAKLSSEIVTSSIWDEDSDTCKVWITLLALANCDGYVRGSDGWLAKVARVSIDNTIRALNKFQEADPSSRTPDNDGRRLQVVDRGWLILNYHIFRANPVQNESHVKELNRARQRRFRQRHKAPGSNDVTLRNVTAASVSVQSTLSGKVQAEMEGVQGEVELPPGFPGTEAEAIAACMALGVEDEFVRATWNKAAGRGGLDSKQVPIRRFANHVQTEWSYEQQRRRTQNTRNSHPQNPREIKPVRGSSPVNGF